MCGIFGVVGHIEQERAASCRDLLTHRGPDAAGMWRGEGVTLGHRRLAILDLSEAGRQPMSDSSGRLHITFSGEIFNFVELQRELAAMGHIFRSGTDTEVILAAFDQWGEGCLGRFNGFWAFGIWDARDRTLFLARDRLGKKPLFYAQPSGVEFAFASEMKALTPLLDAVLPNLGLLKDQHRIFTYEGSPDCLIDGLKRFPAGSCGWYRGGRLTIRRWWSTLDSLIRVPDTYQEQVELVRETFLDACRIRMRSDVPIGTALSGGLDSSATISSMVQVADSRPGNRGASDWRHAFVASFPGTSLDEAPFARRVCEHLGIPLEVIRIDPAAAAGRMLDYCYLFEESYITSPIPFMLTYAAVKEHGISVTLDGHGADEIFGGYPFDFIFALGDAGMNFRNLNNVLDAYFDAIPPGPEFGKPRVRSLFALQWMAKDRLKRIVRRGAKWSGRDSGHHSWARLDNLSKRLYISTHETVLPTLLRNYDRYGMANGVEIRMPFLDHRMVSLAFSLPWTSKIRRGFSKAIVRDAVAPFLPNDIAYRKTKIGFNSPFLDWMRGSLRQFMYDTIASRSFLECDLIDSRRVAKEVRKAISSEKKGDFNYGQQVWMMVAPYFWEQGFLLRVQREARDLA